MYDLIIIGAGPAGITASVYAARKKMNFLVITKDIGGQAAWSGDIENYPGYQFITGPDLTAKFEEHMRNYKMEVREGLEAIDLRQEGGSFIVKTMKGDYQAKSVIIASGKKAKELMVPGEKEFKYKGVAYCATCDGPLFAGKDVAVVGGGNSALDAAIQLIKIAKHVYLINLTDRLTGDLIIQERLKAEKNVSVFNDTHITAILGEKMVSAVKIRKDAQESTLSVQGVFIEIGLIPNSYFAKEIAKNERNEIKIDCRNQTSIPGIFAAGDVTDVPEKQIVIAAGEGAKAVLEAFRYVNTH